MEGVLKNSFFKSATADKPAVPGQQGIVYLRERPYVET